MGTRWVLPSLEPRPYLAASYQAALTKDHPVQEGSVQNLGAYLNTQGSGQEFQRLWTLGVGISF
jgi:hypothetical protein